MKLDVSKLETGTTRIERSYAASAIPFDYRDYSLAEPWIFEADVTKNAREEVAIKGHLRGSVKVSCDRCLEAFEYPVQQSFNFYFIPAHRRSREEERELEAEELDENFYDDPEISLVDLINEQIILELPLKMLCQTECKGLCQRCGVNLNQDGCRCGVNNTDLRLILLEEMKKRIKTD